MRVVGVTTVMAVLSALHVQSRYMDQRLQWLVVVVVVVQTDPHSSHSQPATSRHGRQTRQTRSVINNINTSNTSVTRIATASLEGVPSLHLQYHDHSYGPSLTGLNLLYSPLRAQRGTPGRWHPSLQTMTTTTMSRMTMRILRVDRQVQGQEDLHLPRTCYRLRI